MVLLFSVCFFAFCPRQIQAPPEEKLDIRVLGSDSSVKELDLNALSLRGKRKPCTAKGSYDVFMYDTEKGVFFLKQYYDRRPREAMLADLGNLRPAVQWAYPDVPDEELDEWILETQCKAYETISTPMLAGFKGILCTTPETGRALQKDVLREEYNGRLTKKIAERTSQARASTDPAPTPSRKDDRPLPDILREKGFHKEAKEIEDLKERIQISEGLIAQLDREMNLLDLLDPLQEKLEKLQKARDHRSDNVLKLANELRSALKDLLKGDGYVNVVNDEGEIDQTLLEQAEKALREKKNSELMSLASKKNRLSANLQKFEESLEVKKREAQKKISS